MLASTTTSPPCAPDAKPSSAKNAASTAATLGSAVMTTLAVAGDRARMRRGMPAVRGETPQRAGVDVEPARREAGRRRGDRA